MIGAFKIGVDDVKRDLIMVDSMFFDERLSFFSAFKYFFNEANTFKFITKSMAGNVVAGKSYAFALNVIELYQALAKDKREFILSRQFLKSGTAIGALIREAEHAQSKADFLNKMNIALKEANETIYWIQLLKDSGYISISEYDSVFPKAIELVRLLASIVKTIKNKIGKN